MTWLSTSGHLLQGSSHVALYEESKMAEDTEGGEPSHRLHPRPSAVTRLRPYTSLYIPQGPRYDTRAEPLRRASHSLPRDGEHSSCLCSSGNQTLHLP